MNFNLPSQSVFTRFVKSARLVPRAKVDSDHRLRGAAERSFPDLTRSFWDYQIHGRGVRTTCRDVVLAAIKADQLDEINASVNKGRPAVLTIDVAPMALSNALSLQLTASSPGCSLLIDIGARTDKPLFFVEGKACLQPQHTSVGGSTISAAIARGAQAGRHALWESEDREGALSGSRRQLMPSPMTPAKPRSPRSSAIR